MSVLGLYVIYGILLIVGGVMGFAKAKSRPSLISGIVTGIVSILLAVLSNNVQYRGTALVIGILLSIALGIFFLRRYAETKKPMPSMFMAVVSFIVAFGSIVLWLIVPRSTS